MHFISTKSELIKAISIASKATSKLQRTVLECIMIDCGKNSISIRATDISLSIETVVTAEIIEEGKVALPARQLMDIVSKFPESDIVLKSTDGKKLQVKCMNSLTEFTCMDADEFPVFPEKPEGSYAKVSEGTLKKMLNETMFAVSDAEDKPILTGVHFEADTNTLELCALDGYRMAVRTEDIICDEKTEFVVPSRAAREISHIAGDNENTVKFATTKNMALFEINGTSVYTRLLEGKYVNYKNLIPKNQTIEVITERQMLKESVERAAVFAKEHNNLIKLNISENIMEITGESEYGNINEKIPVVQNGDDIEIAFSSKDVLDVVRAIPDDNIKFSFISSVSPSVATGTESSGYLYLLLPLKIR